MTDQIPYVDKLRQQLLDARRRHPNPAWVARMPRKAAGVLVAVLLVAGVGIPLVALRGLGSKSVSSAAGSSHGHRLVTGQLVATTTQLQPGIRALTLASGDVWVVSYTSLFRLDGATGNVKATIPLKSEDQASLVAAGGLIWVSDGIQTITAVNPTTNKVVGSVQAPARLEGLAAAQGEMWASIGMGSGSLLQIDPASDRVVKQVPVGDAGSLSLAGNSLWIHDNNNGGSSLQFDLSTGAPGMKLDGTSGDVVFGGGFYWTIFSDDPTNEQATTVIAIDPATGKTVATLPAPRAGQLAASPTGIWLLSAPGTLPDDSWDPNQPATVSLIDPVARAYVGTPVPVDNTPAWIAPGDNSLWVSHYDSGTVTKVTLQS